jgi:hypothetical protein
LAACFAAVIAGCCFCCFFLYYFFFFFFYTHPLPPNSLLDSPPLFRVKNGTCYSKLVTRLYIARAGVVNVAKNTWKVLVFAFSTALAHKLHCGVPGSLMA